jgi:hypothetical protein
MLTGFDRYFQLGARPVGGRDQNGIAIAGGFEVEKRTETA